MSDLTIELTAMAHGGNALGRDKKGQVVFVPYGIPGERVRVRVPDSKRKFFHGELIGVEKRSAERVKPTCEHFGECGGCHFQHMAYDTQLAWKRKVVIDQLNRIGRIKQAKVLAVIPSPEQYGYQMELSLNRAENGRLGLWSPTQKQVMPINKCHIIDPGLQELFEDIDFDLPELRKLTLRRGSDGALLAALEVEGVEPPSLLTDFPISVTIVLPDGTAANLVGDNYFVQTINGHDFRISGGVFCHPNPGVIPHLIETVQAYAQLTGEERVLELYSGMGMLTAFLAPNAGEIIGVEYNEDAINDAVINLHDWDNVSLYASPVATAIPSLEMNPDVVVADAPLGGLDKAVIRQLQTWRPRRFVYVSSDVATFARDAGQLTKQGYSLREVQPLDMQPQHFQVQTVSLWTK
ncbi:MAG TPA: TRAM domain-containing protein [Anaerolineae bacterium]|nr:TRAM domain-containing protein [Anaerolineae bacterium]